MSQEPLTTAEYLDRGGGICPHCRSSNLEPGGTDCGHVTIWRTVVCLDCAAYWVETYELTEYSELQVKED